MTISDLTLDFMVTPERFYNYNLYVILDNVLYFIVLYINYVGSK